MCKQRPGSEKKKKNVIEDVIYFDGRLRLVVGLAVLEKTCSII